MAVLRLLFALWQTFGQEVNLKEMSELTLGEFEAAVVSSTKKNVNPLVAGKVLCAVLYSVCFA